MEKSNLIAKWHEDYLKHKKWVQDFKSTKNSSFNDVARWHIAKDYELWIPDYIIERCYGLIELKNKIESIIKINKEAR